MEEQDKFVFNSQGFNKNLPEEISTSDDSLSSSASVVEGLSEETLRELGKSVTKRTGLHLYGIDVILHAG